MTYPLSLAVTAAALSLASFAHAADPLVDVAWVTENLDSEDVVFVDLRSGGAYLDGHIPGAVHTQYGGPKDQWRMKVGQVRGLVREPEQIAAHLGRIGVSNDDHIVLIPGGTSSSDMGAATRVYWTLSYLGHDELSILDGGMAAYLKELDDKKIPLNPLQKGKVDRGSASFVAKPREHMLLTADDVEIMVATGVVPVDNRTRDFHLGITKSGAAKTAGTIPNSVNLPHSWLTVDAKGSFRESDALAALYAAAGVSLTDPQINFCNTGHLASIGWFVSHELLNNKNALLFDGSMAEWTHTGHITDQKVTF
ncbi:sulfurtransferase [Marivita geojedonensis]|uniref:sulfurtransferase n=1 Tax=Marivita geojedonensis TaxID=1123756 RepID=UPI000A1E56C4|nr:rhodanese-like domain-containing protein [Marivita geojedonensis]PRY81512.1 thiosulfate/3-mercaptopyruvate sulfurtransferase [Marivita geojedonensis]